MYELRSRSKLSRMETTRNDYVKKIDDTEQQFQRQNIASHDWEHKIRKASFCQNKFQYYIIVFWFHCSLHIQNAIWVLNVHSSKLCLNGYSDVNVKMILITFSPGMIDG